MAGVLVLVGSAPAGAAVDVIVDSTSIELEQDDDGKVTGSVVLINTASSDVVPKPRIKGDAGCTVTADPTSIEPGRRTSVTLTFRGCEVDQGADVVLRLGRGVTPRSVTLEAKAPAADAGPDWDILRWALGGASLIVALVFVGVMSGLNDLRTELKSTEAVAARKTARLEAHRLQTKVAEAMGEAPPPEPPEEAAPEVRWGTPLTSLGTDWSLTSWITNVTVGATALVALIAASDVLEAALGSKPEAALSLITVALAIGAAFVALAPLMLKAIGEKASVPTVGGTLLAGHLVLFGSAFQIVAVTRQATQLTATTWVDALVVALGAATALAVLLYGVRSLVDLVKEGMEPATSPLATEIQAALIVARGFRTDPDPAPLADALAGATLTPVVRTLGLAGGPQRSALL